MLRGWSHLFLYPRLGRSSLTWESWSSEWKSQEWFLHYHVSILTVELPLDSLSQLRHAFELPAPLRKYQTTICWGGGCSFPSKLLWGWLSVVQPLEGIEIQWCLWDFREEQRLDTKLCTWAVHLDFQYFPFNIWLQCSPRPSYWP